MENLKYLIKSGLFSLIPLRSGSKLPYTREFKSFRVNSFSDVGLLCRERLNLGVLCVDGLVVIDVDDESMSYHLLDLLLFRGIRTYVVRTRRGMHFYFRCKQYTIRSRRSKSSLKSFVDIKKNGGYVVSEGSVVDGFEYTSVVAYDEIFRITNRNVDIFRDIFDGLVTFKWRLFRREDAVVSESVVDSDASLFSVSKRVRTRFSFSCWQRSHHLCVEGSYFVRGFVKKSKSRSESEARIILELHCRGRSKEEIYQHFLKYMTKFDSKFSEMDDARRLRYFEVSYNNVVKFHANRICEKKKFIALFSRAGMRTPCLSDSNMNLVLQCLIRLYCSFRYDDDFVKIADVVEYLPILSRYSATKILHSLMNLGFVCKREFRKNGVFILNVAKIVAMMKKIRDVFVKRQRESDLLLDGFSHSLIDFCDSS